MRPTSRAQRVQPGPAGGSGYDPRTAVANGCPARWPGGRHAGRCRGRPPSRRKGPRARLHGAGELGPILRPLATLRGRAASERAGSRYGYDPASPVAGRQLRRRARTIAAAPAVTRPETRCAMAMKSPVACGPRIGCATTARMRSSRTTAIGRFPKRSTAAGPTSAPWPNRIAARRPGPTGFRRDS